jgi:flagellar hook assembly protein FlgD
MVRTLARGAESAGPHVATWDGRDDGGRTVAAGAYWVRLSASGREVTRRIVRLP